MVRGGKVNGKIDAIPSKSYAHRISICNFLSGKDPVAFCGGFSSKDIEVTKDCLLQLKDGKTVLDCGESGSTLRFLIPLCAVLGGKYVLIGHGRLMERPNEQLFSVIKAHGVNASQNGKVELDGKLCSGDFYIRGDVSSQYISGLLMALPMLEGDSRIILTTPLVSRPYVDITIEVLNGYGIQIQSEKDSFFIKGGQKYSGDLLPEGDWSNMAFFLVMGAVAGKICVSGLNINSVQGDKKILDILRLAKANLTMNKDEITVEKSELNAFSFSAQDCPDLVPIASVLAGFCKGVSEIRDVERLKIKESDRIESTLKMLKAFNIKAESDGHSIKVYGGQVKAGEVDSFNDHRIVMSASVLGLGAKGNSKILNAQAVEKSYPSFFKDVQSVGGIVYAI